MKWSECKSFVLMLLYAPLTVIDFECPAGGEVRFYVAVLNGSFKSAVQGSVDARQMSRKL